MLLVGEIFVHASGGDRADTVDRGQLHFGRVHDAIEITERRRQCFGRDAANVAHVETDEQRGQWTRLRRFDRGAQILHGEFAEPLAGAQAVEVDGVDVADVVDESVVDEQLHPRLAQALDIHRFA